jgi:hypothetical protein
MTAPEQHISVTKARRTTFKGISINKYLNKGIFLWDSFESAGRISPSQETKNFFGREDRVGEISCGTD